MIIILGCSHICNQITGFFVCPQIAMSLILGFSLLLDCSRLINVESWNVAVVLIQVVRGVILVIFVTIQGEPFIVHGDPSNRLFVSFFQTIFLFRRALFNYLILFLVLFILLAILIFTLFDFVLLTNFTIFVYGRLYIVHQLLCINAIIFTNICTSILLWEYFLGQIMLLRDFFTLIWRQGL